MSLGSGFAGLSDAERVLGDVGAAVSRCAYLTQDANDGMIIAASRCPNPRPTRNKQKNIPENPHLCVLPTS